MPTEPERSWEQVRQSIRRSVSGSQFRTWFAGLQLTEWSRERVKLTAPSSYTRDWLERHFRPLIEEAIAEVAGASPALELLHLRAGAPTRPAPTTAVRRAPAEPVPQSALELNDTYRFESFVVGPCNNLPHAAGLAVAQAPATTYNPLFVHGSVGLGKTHLLQAICHQLLDDSPRLQIHYLSCETFVNEFIAAIERRELEAFRDRYRQVDVLMIDDIHYLAGKERTQEEFFHTFNSLYNAKRQIVISSDSSPKEIPLLTDRLVSRFKWGLVTQFEVPGFETRAAIVNQKAERLGRPFPTEVSQFVAERIQSNIRELEGAVNRIIATAQLQGIDTFSVGFAERCLKDLIGPGARITVGDIVDVVTGQLDCKQVDLQSRSRTRKISLPRQICMYLSKKLTDHSLEEIGRHFGGRDHSTVVYAIKVVEKKIADREETRRLVRQLEEQVLREKSLARN